MSRESEIYEPAEAGLSKPMLLDTSRKSDLKTQICVTWYNNNRPGWNPDQRIRDTRIMKRNIKIIAALLIVLNLTTIVSCSKVKEKADKKSGANASEVVETSKEIAKALAKCDLEAVKDHCSGHTKDLEKAMPVIDKDEEASEELLIDNMIASTIEYTVDEDSFSSERLGKSCSVDVVFTYTDYNKTLERKEKFLDIYDFEDTLKQTSNTVEVTIPFEFEKKKDEYVLTNADDLTELYEYDVDVEFLDSFFDYVEDIYMVGPQWSEEDDGYYDTNTFEMVLKISEEGQEYDWEYSYKVALEKPEFTNIYMSPKITEVTPEEIHITYSQEENFEEGFYCILVYSDHDDTIIGYEFDVFRTESSSQQD